MRLTRLPDSLPFIWVRIRQLQARANSNLVKNHEIL
ncbi:hypothetical protein SAMN05444000_11793 [Shimia gijangensis]|uniref:Uncharacterized protein n=1 Tax=Shimia gijangensis TaxID=1470563 RepID=A0A1M6P7Q7_9RHOB|nr:hypothetical protein SAMN05444000_11793 [Shimia gijangensis]